MQMTDCGVTAFLASETPLITRDEPYILDLSASKQALAAEEVPCADADQTCSWARFALPGDGVWIRSHTGRARAELVDDERVGASGQLAAHISEHGLHASNRDGALRGIAGRHGQWWGGPVAVSLQTKTIGLRLL